MQPRMHRLKLRSRKSNLLKRERNNLVIEMKKKINDVKLVKKITTIIVLSVIIVSLLCALSMDILNHLSTYEAAGYNRNAKIFVMVSTIFFEFLIVLCGVFVIKAVKKPLDEIVRAIKVIGEGGVEIQLKKINDDEFGIITDELNAMVESVRKNAKIAAEIADGDLSMEVEPRTGNDVMGRAFKKLVNDQNHVLGNIREASMQVTTGSEQVASASQSLAQGSTEQASALEQISASIDDIAERTKVNAAQANEANTLVHEAKSGAVRGNAQMDEMIGAMHEINSASENISKIIKVIDDIAFQTNILALNAAVEAARAGSHGKGFAVVAEEVRNLAGKSAQAASETAELIEDSISKVARGSKLAEDTAKALEVIVGNVDKIVEIISSIATASNEQATAITQIDQAIGQVSQVVQSNSATSEQCAAASEELSNQAHRLRELIARFKLQSYDQPYYQNTGMQADMANDNEHIISLGSGFGKY